MSRWWLVLALVLSIGVNVGLVASHLLDRRGASGGEGRLGVATTGVESAAERMPRTAQRRQGIPPWIDRFADALALDGDRRHRFVEIQQRFVAALEERRVARHESQAALRHALLRPEPDRAEIERLVTELGAAQAAIEGAFADNVLASRALLEPREERRFLEALRRLRLEAGRRARR